MLHEDVVLVIIVGVGVETHFLGRNQGAQDVAAVVQDAGRIHSTEISALGVEELAVDGPQDGVGGHTIEVGAALGQGVGQGVTVSLDANVIPCAGAVDVVLQADNQSLYQGQGLGLGGNSVLHTGDKVFGLHVVIFFTLIGGPDSVITDDEGPLGSVFVMAPFFRHTGDQLAVGILGQQAFDEVGQIVTVGGLVVEDIVQGGNVEIIDHGIGVRCGFLCRGEAEAAQHQRQRQNQRQDLGKFGHCGSILSIFVYYRSGCAPDE